jgi:hypothetical protein
MDVWEMGCEGGRWMELAQDHSSGGLCVFNLWILLNRSSSLNLLSVGFICLVLLHAVGTILPLTYQLKECKVLLPPQVLLVLWPHGRHHVVEVHDNMDCVVHKVRKCAVTT